MNVIKVGFVQNTHGIKGDLKIEPLTTHIERFDAEIDFYLGESLTPVRIERFYEQKGVLIIHFKEITDINQALHYKGQYLYVDEKDRFVLPEGEYYIDDLIGLSVVEDERVLGEIEDVITEGAQDIYVCRRSDGKTFYIPVVPEFVREIDLEHGLCRVRLIDGLIE